MSATDDLAERILARFREGNDTADLARIFRLPEHRVSLLLHVARSREKGRPALIVKRGIVKQIGPKAA